MELMIGGAVVAAAAWIISVVQKQRQKEPQRKVDYLGRPTFSGKLTRSRNSLYDHMDQTSDTYLKNVDDTLRR